MRLFELEQKEYSPKQVGQIIRKKIDQFGEDAWYINNGWCQSFANKIADILGPEAKVVSSSHDYKNGTFPGHSWVEYKGKHYDAESPDGESNPKQMQYHRRLRALADSPEDMDEKEAVRNALGHDPIYYGEK